MDDFASSERPEWLRALAQRTARSSEEATDNAGTKATAQAPSGHSQRSPRVRTLIRAVIGGENRPGEDVIVRNVSPGGMCIASRTLCPATGDMLRVSLPGQADLQAQVRWVGEGEFGVLLTGGLDVGRIQDRNRRSNEGFTVALENLLGFRPQQPRVSAGARPV